METGLTGLRRSTEIFRTFPLLGLGRYVLGEAIGHQPEPNSSDPETVSNPAITSLHDVEESRPKAFQAYTDIDLG